MAAQLGWTIVATYDDNSIGAPRDATDASAAMHCPRDATLALQRRDGLGHGSSRGWLI
jgi:hypothetical protein